MSKYLVWFAKSEGNSCVLGAVVGFDSNRLRKGEALSKDWPSGVSLSMDREYPDDVRLLDNAQNLEGFVVVSESLMRFLEKRSVKNVEYLPVTIVNQEGRAESARYFIVNPVGTHDVLDVEASEPEMFGDQILTVMQTVIREEELDPDLDLIRLARFASPTLVTRKLAEEIDGETFSGVSWKELESFEG